MNKKILVALVLSMSIMFCGCSSSSPAAAGSEPSSVEIVSEIEASSSVVKESIENEDVTNESVVETTEKVKEQQYLIDSAFDKNSPTYNEDLKSIIQSQIKAQNNPFIFIEDNWVYGVNWDSKGNPKFVKERSEGGDYTILDKSGTPTNVYIKDGYIYYSLTDGVYKIRTSGQDRECIIDIKDASIQVVDDYIYYTPDTYVSSEEIDADNSVTHLYRCKLDGSEKTEIIDRPTFCWYVFENAILYQDDRDNVSLHILNLNTNEDTKLNDETSFNPIFDGEYVYYVRSKDDIQTIWKVKPDGTENQEVAAYHCTNEVSLYDNKIYFSYEDDDYRLYCMDKNGENLTQISQDPYIRNTTIQGNTLLYVISTKDFKYIDHIVFCNTDGSNVVTLEFDD